MPELSAINKLPDDSSHNVPLRANSNVLKFVVLSLAIVIVMAALFLGSIWLISKPQRLGPTVRIEFLVAAEVQPDESWKSIEIEGESASLFLSPTPVITQDDIAAFEISTVEDVPGMPVHSLDLEFTPKGALELSRLTSNRQGTSDRLAVFIDGKLMTCAYMNGTITHRAQITLPTMNTDEFQQLQKRLAE